MGIRTRSATSSPVKGVRLSDLPAVSSQSHPVKIIVASRNISSDARFLSLNHPRDDSRQRFLFCPSKGLFEITKLNTKSADPRSILFTSCVLTGGDEELSLHNSNKPFCTTKTGYINKDAEILTATPFDMAFIVLRLLAPEAVTSKKSMFQPLDDIIDIPDTEDKHFTFVLEEATALVGEAMSRICDSVEAGDEKMFRYNEEKVLKLMLNKADRVVKCGLPASLEQQFVTRMLEAPVASITREESSTVSVIPGSRQAVPSADSFDSQSTTTDSTASAVFSDTLSTSTTLTVEDDTSANVWNLQRTRVAFNFIAASYLPTNLAKRLQQVLQSSTSPIDFQPLDDHLKNLSLLRAEALASRSLGDYSRKRGHEDDDEAAEARAEKKRKQEEEEKRRKANESRGVRDLKKVNVTGMKKMSQFFTKKPAAAKAKS